MTVHDILTAAVAVPIKRADYKGDATQYITYHSLGQTGTLYAEGTEAETGSLFSVDIWSSGDYISLLESVKTALQQAGFAVVVLAEYYDSKCGYYHVVLEATCVGAQYG